MSLDFSRLRRADRIIGGGAIALFVFMFFFKWYGVSSSSSIGGVSFSSSANGWHSFTNSRWIWLITIIVALGYVCLTAAQRELDIPVQGSVIVAALGTLSALLIAYRIIDHPSAGASGTIAGVHYSASAGIKIGIWLGLIAAVAIAYGGYLAMQQEGTSLAHVHEQASGAFSGIVTTPAAQPAAPAAQPPAPAAEPSAPFPPIPPAAGPPAVGSAGEPPAVA